MGLLVSEVFLCILSMSIEHSGLSGHCPSVTSLSIRACVQTLGAIPTADVYLYLSKTLEAHRIHIFDLITQFRALFSHQHDTPDTGCVCVCVCMSQVCVCVCVCVCHQ